jgi:membrane protein
VEERLRDVRQRGFRFIIPGGGVALVVWITASIAFALYVANFGSRNKTYGTLRAVIVWLYISNNALLLGAEFNAEMERQRVLKRGRSTEEKLELGVQPVSASRDLQGPNPTNEASVRLAMSPKGLPSESLQIAKWSPGWTTVPSSSITR